MRVVLTRIDNRLLHGIVATQWAPRSGAQRVMVIDDETASNEIAKTSMRLARPAGMAISIIDLETALANFKAKKYEGQDIFIIAKSLSTILALIENSNVPIIDINVGATAQRKPEPGDVVINRRITLSEDEADYCRTLIGRGVRVYAQYLPSDKPELLNELLY